MEKTALTGAQKSRLRGLGQRMDASIKIGKDGLTPTILSEVRRQLGAHELVKLRYVGTERDERAAMSAKLSEETGSHFVGSVGQTALFFTPSATAGKASLLESE
ncbi:MAG TPA: YhbY family RNA-binding protein [Opitutaceae bacterium]|nr:YhbY family RNA-binding protein [Opitutaceae bacterium]